MDFVLDSDGSTITTAVAQSARDVYLNFTVNVPLQLTCYVQILFPSTVMIDIDETITQISGTGFMDNTYAVPGSP